MRVSLACAAVVAVCLVVGLPTILRPSYFLGDDFGLVGHLHKQSLAHLFLYFVSDWTEGIYGFKLDELRPLLAFSYWLDSQVFGVANATGYHVTNIALHAVNSLLVFGIARSVVPARTGFALVAGCLFAVMPCHAEPIAWISGRVDSLAGVFYLGAFLCFLHFRGRHSYWWLTATMVLFVLGLFAKQSIVTFPVLILAYDAVHDPGLRTATWRQRVSRYRVHVPFFVILILYLWLRSLLFDNVLREGMLTVGAFGSFVLRQWFYVSSMLPVPPDLPPVGRTAVAVVSLAVLAAAALWLRGRWQEDRQLVRRLVFFGAAWYAITIAPMIVTYGSARHLYLTAAGVSIAVASLLLPAGWHTSRRSVIARCLVIGVLVILSTVSLSSRLQGWIANGVEAHRYAHTLPGLLGPLPAGSTVMIDIRHGRRGMWFWSWALPFALQQPFVSDNLYDRLAIVEWPIVYACPPDQWWAAKQRALGPILGSDGTHELTYIVPDPRDEGSLIMQQRTVSGPVLRTEIEAAIGKPVSALAAGITLDEAERVAAILFQ